MSENWTKEVADKFQVKKAEEVLKRIKRERYSTGKKYKLVKILDRPLTYKEIEIK